MNNKPTSFFRRARNTSLCIVILHCALLSAGTGNAADAGGREITAEAGAAPTALTLRQCIDTALEKNHTRGASRYSIAIAEAQHRQALSAYWPQIDANGSYSMLDEDPNFIFPAKTMQTPASTMSGTINMGMPVPFTINVPAGTYSIPEQNVKLMDRKNFVATLNATLPIYTGGKISAVVRQAEQGTRAAREEARRTDLQVIYDTTRYYYGAVLARELAQIATDALTRMEVTLDLTESLYTRGSGKVRKTDYLRNKTVVEGLRTAAAALEANEELAKAALANSMGLEWNNQVEPALRELPFTPVNADLKELVSGVYRFNPDWARLEAGLEAAAAKIDEAGSGHLPKIGLFGSIKRIENSYDRGIVTPENRNSWIIGVGIELPLFNGFRTTNEVREAKARLARLKEQQLLLRDGIALQVKHIFIQMMSAQKQKKSAEAATLSSEENRALNERAYQEELVETKDVIEAQLVESLMKAQYRKALFDNLDARANLEFVVGKEVDSLLNSI